MTDICLLHRGSAQGVDQGPPGQPAPAGAEADPAAGHLEPASGRRRTSFFNLWAGHRRRRNRFGAEVRISTRSWPARGCQDDRAGCRSSRSARRPPPELRGGQRVHRQGDPRPGRRTARHGDLAAPAKRGAAIAQRASAPRDERASRPTFSRRSPPRTRSSQEGVPLLHAMEGPRRADCRIHGLKCARTRACASSRGRDRTQQ